jgi:hypothetical protein
MQLVGAGLAEATLNRGMRLSPDELGLHQRPTGDRERQMATTFVFLVLLCQNF